MFWRLFVAAWFSPDPPATGGASRIVGLGCLILVGFVSGVWIDSLPDGMLSPPSALRFGIWCASIFVFLGTVTVRAADRTVAKRYQQRMKALASNRENTPLVAGVPVAAPPANPVVPVDESKDIVIEIYYLKSNGSLDLGRPAGDIILNPNGAILGRAIDPSGSNLLGRFQAEFLERSKKKQPSPIAEPQAEPTRQSEGLEFQENFSRLQQDAANHGMGARVSQMP